MEGGLLKILEPGTVGLLRSKWQVCGGGDGWRTLCRRGPTQTTFRLIRLCKGAKRDFSAAQTDTFAGAKVEEKASVCFGPACGRQAKW